MSDRKETAFGVYALLGGSLTTKLSETREQADSLRREIASKFQMPNETYEDALERYVVVKVTVSYRKPQWKKK